MKLDELDGSRWTGRCELWKDPLGDVVTASECSLTVAGSTLRYRWSHEGEEQEGALTLTDDGGAFRDSFHQSESMALEVVDNPRSIATRGYRYMETWGWRINLCHREPTGQLVLQMTNIAPWGEEARAVRMTFDRADG